MTARIGSVIGSRGTDVQVLLCLCQHLRYAVEVQDRQFLRQILVFDAANKMTYYFFVCALGADCSALDPVGEGLQTFFRTLSERVK